jgi:hypothetical protein
MEYATDVKQARLAAVVAKIDDGVGPAYIEIGTAGMALVLATITLADPCGTATNDILIFVMPQSDTAANATGTAAEARIRNFSGADRITGLTVGVGTGNIKLLSTTISQGQKVTLTSATITHG